MKLTAKQEAFCQAIAEGKTQIDAHTSAYPNNMTREQRDVQANKLLKNPKISLRIAELKERAMKRHDVTVDSIMAEYDEARVLAKKIGHPASMVSATTGKAKVAGLIVDKSEQKQSGEIKVIGKVEIVHVEPKA